MAHLHRVELAVVVLVGLVEERMEGGGGVRSHGGRRHALQPPARSVRDLSLGMSSSCGGGDCDAEVTPKPRCCSAATRICSS